MAAEYVFIDEWDVHAPIESVFHALSDARTYPLWWKPVYIGVSAGEGPVEAGAVAMQHFKGRLPYHLRTRAEVTRYEPPHLIESKVTGDLSGTGIWTLTQAGPDTVHVKFDWRVAADRPFIRLLTPILRPLFRWNHNWAIARAKEGLEPYARSHSGAISNVD
ncbi:MAG TPA: SRPBCC family protein [Dehalococcoidia bacterium]|nr:SRPBCC family protein [Dehalococcoidia bacterium]